IAFGAERTSACVSTAKRFSTPQATREASRQSAGADAGRSYYNQRLLQSVTNITEHLHAVRERVRIAAERTGRTAGDVMIVAVSKQQPSAAIQSAYRAGQRHFGESYVQEAERKLA